MGDEEHDLDLTHLKLTPKQLYNNIPHPKVRLTLGSCLFMIGCAFRTCICTALGQWKRSWNLRPLRVRDRTRDLTCDMNRGHFDKYDYVAIERASAKLICSCTLWLPGMSAIGFMGLYANKPPMRHLDDSLDIMKHKLEEYVERGVAYKQAEISLKRHLISKPEHHTKENWTRIIEKVSRIVAIGNLATLVCMTVLLTGENAKYLAPPLALALLGSITVQEFIEHVMIPLLMLPNIILVSVTRPTEDEKKVDDEMDKILGSSDNSDTESSSTEYSSANESFLDEDPVSKEGPKVLGVKRAKVLIRPKASRLRLRFALLRSTAPFGTHLDRFRREDPNKFCRLLRVPGAHLDALRPACTISFRPTLESDSSFKEARFGLRRAKSLGTSTAEETFERRVMTKHEHREGWADIFDERSSSGLPAMPSTQCAVPARGLIDEFEAQGVFRQWSAELEDKELLLINPFTDTPAFRRANNLANMVSGTPALPRTAWDASMDEELNGYVADAEEAVKNGEARVARLRNSVPELVTEIVPDVVPELLPTASPRVQGSESGTDGPSGESEDSGSSIG